MKKLTFEYVKQYFEDRGCELLETEYINSKIKMRYICKCGNEAEIKFNSFQTNMDGTIVIAVNYENFWGT